MKGSNLDKAEVVGVDVDVLVPVSPLGQSLHGG